VPRRSLVAFVVAVAAVAALTPFAIARAGDRGAGGLPPDAGLTVKGDAKPAAIDMTGAQPAAPRTDQLALDPTSVPGLFFCRKYNIFSYVASRYIAEERSMTGTRQNLLRARTPAGATGAWEAFEVCSSDSGHTVYLKAPSEYLVTAEYNVTGRGAGQLRGRGEWVDAWETFDVWSDSHGYYLRNVSKGWYFTCRVDYTGDLYQVMKATGTAPGSWEALRFDPV
jgi:hypothetical protein